MSNLPFNEASASAQHHGAAGPATAAARADPLSVSKDIGASWSVLAVRKAGELLVAGLFFPFLPLWMPLTWLALVSISGALHTWGFSRLRCMDMPVAKRMWIGRVLFWINLACQGSAAYFLYVPDNPGMVGVLNVCLVCIGALCILQHTGDNLLGAAGTALAILPMAMRFLWEGGWVNTLQGIGGFMITFLLAVYGRQQQAALIEQAALRKRAEDAADVVAAVGLAKARFFAAVSHDLRQPVHAMGLYLAPLLAGTKDQRTEKAVQGIYQSWHALDDLLSHVLDLTQMDAGKIQAELSAVELAPLITGLVVQHSAAAEKKSIRILALVAPQRYVLADMLMLKRVLSNLLDNAIKFSPEDARIAVAVRSAGADWCIQVRDSGPGIALAMQTKVFEEFVQIDNPERDRTQGLGLGLAIAQRFTVLMQGQMHLRSASGAGSCLSVHLPKAQGPAIDMLHTSKAAQNQMAHLAPQAALSVPDALRKAVRASGKSILVVEDDALVAQAIMQLLADLELPAVHAANAVDAIKLAAQSCVAACDVRLPGIVSGLDLAIRLQHMHIPSLLMTGETGNDTKEAARHNGLLLLVKPVNPQALLDALASLQLTPTH